MMEREVVARLVYSMIQFLKKQLESSGTSSSLSEEGAESVEVALQCLETAYGITQDSTHLAVSKPLYEIFQEAVKEEIVLGISNNTSSEPTVEDKADAERFKNDGNLLMREEKFDKALECYTKAVGKDRTNSVYYCNRAAAHSKLNNHLEAIEDCKRALRIEPQYGKAYGRMGLAYSALGKALEAKECYQKALELEPDNESYKGNLQIAEDKLRSQSQPPSQSSSNANPFSALAGGGGFDLSSLGSLAGLASGGGSGPPDIQGLLSNPALMNVATQIMSDPNMQNMMASILDNFTTNPAGGGAVTQQAPPTSLPNTEGAPSGTPPGVEALLSAGRQLAEQMQTQHPDLVAQLLGQMNRPGDGHPPPPPQNDDASQDPPPPTT